MVFNWLYIVILNTCLTAYIYHCFRGHARRRDPPVRNAKRAGNVRAARHVCTSTRSNLSPWPDGGTWPTSRRTPPPRTWPLRCQLRHVRAPFKRSLAIHSSVPSDAGNFYACSGSQGNKPQRARAQACLASETSVMSFPLKNDIIFMIFITLITYMWVLIKILSLILE
jgi:hypothetical protein